MRAVISYIRPIVGSLFNPEDQTVSERLNRIQKEVVQALVKFGPALAVGYSAASAGKQLLSDSFVSTIGFFIISNSKKSKERLPLQAVKIGICTVGIGLTTTLHAISVAEMICEPSQWTHQKAALKAGGRALTIALAVKNTLATTEGDESKKERLEKSSICVISTVVWVGSILTTISVFAMQQAGGPLFNQTDTTIEHQATGIISSLAALYFIQPLIENPGYLLKWIGE